MVSTEKDERTGDRPADGDRPERERPPRVDVREFAGKWQKEWARAKLFEPKIDRGRAKLFITVPYPYISGSLHIGHARVVTEADVYSRFERMRGKNVLYPIAFHISGTPVLGISTAIAQGDEKKINLYKGYVRNYLSDEKEVERTVKSFEDPRRIVEFFIPKMKDEFGSLGLGVDWTRSFTSGDVEHQRLVEWQFRKYEEKGYLVRGKYPVLYSLEYENAVGEDDIADGDTDPVDKMEFTLIKFAYGERDGMPVFLVAATLRPETMYGQTNLWANPETTYWTIKVAPASDPSKEELWIVSEECAQKLAYQDYIVEEIGAISGGELLGTTCRAPFVERDLPVLPSLHCDAGIGTGLVTSVPSDAPFDWIALKELQESAQLCGKYGLSHEDVKAIALIPIIRTKGYGDFPAVEICAKMGIATLDQHDLLAEATQEIYKAGFHTGVMRETCGPYAGKRVEEAKRLMREKLIAEGRAGIMWETSRKALDRSGGRIIVAILDQQWFLDFNAPGWKDDARTCLASMAIQPEKFRKEFEDVFAWLDKRPCARRRGLGTKLPQDPDWVIESLSDSTLYMSLYTIKAKLAELGVKGEALTDEFFDYIYLGKGTERDVVEKTGVSAAHLASLREQFAYWYPNDHRHTFPAHLANHLSFSIFAHAATLPEQFWPRKYSFHGMVISEGQKMSKSKGNVVTLLEVKDRYGADTFRAFMCASAMVESTFNWNTQEVEKMKGHLESLFMTLDSAIPQRAAGDLGALTVEAKAFLSRFERGTGRATASLAAMDLHDYASFVLYELPNAYRKMKVGEQELGAVNAYVLPRWIALLAPLVPHVAEELWRRIGGEGFVSVAPWPVVDESLIDEKAEASTERTEQLKADVRTVLGLAKIDEPKAITVFVAEPWRFQFVAMMKELLAETSDPKQVIAKVMASPLKAHGQDIMRLVPAILKDRSKLPLVLLTKDEESRLFLASARDLAKEYGCPVTVEGAEHSSEAKAKQAMPGKPAILVA